MSYDPKCEELAVYFLADHPALTLNTEKYIQGLAQDIQYAIEEWFAGLDDEVTR